MNPQLLMVREKVQKIVSSNFDRVELDKDGDLTFRHHSARIFVRCWTPADDGPIYINLMSPLLLQVKASPELFEHLALHADDKIFGHLHAKQFDDGVTVFISHSLLGDYLDEEELTRACIAVLVSADELDDDLKSQFGGIRFHEDES